MAELKMGGRDIWVRYTDRDGATWTSYHRVWDVGTFMEARQAEARKPDSKLKSVEQVVQPPWRKAA